MKWWEWLPLVICLSLIAGWTERLGRGKPGRSWCILRAVGKIVGFVTYLLP
jgi:hypothetical protein